MSLEEIASPILTDVQCLELEQLAGLGWSKRQCALYFGIHLTKFMNAYDNGTLDPGQIRYHYDRGELVNAKVDNAISSSAQSGNITAIQIYKKELEKNRLRDFKENLLNGNR
jgi:hypothetical protein